MVEAACIGRIKSPDDLLWLARSDLGHIRGLASTKPYARKADWPIEGFGELGFGHGWTLLLIAAEPRPLRGSA